MLEINYFVIFAQFINFGILYLLFKKFIAEKLYEKIEERKQQLEKLRKAEEHYEEKMSLAEEQKKEMMQETRKTTKELMQESESIAKQKASEIIDKANRDALSILEGGRREIEKERKSMLVQMKDHIVDVSLKLNEKMFGDTQVNKEFLKEEIDNLK